MSPLQPDLLAGNPFAPLSELEDETHSSPSGEPPRAMPSGGRRVVLDRKPKDRQERRAVTLGDFLPTGELVRKTRKSRRQRLSLTLGGLEGVVSSRIPLWSDRDLGTDMHETTRRPSWRRRWRLFAGLRGQVSSHFPTHVFRPYRTYRASPTTHLQPRQVTPSVPDPRPQPQTTAPPQPASKPPAASASPPRQPATRHVTATPPKSTTAPPAARAALTPGVESHPPSRQFQPTVAGESPPAQVAASPLPVPQQAATDTSSGSSTGRSAPTRTGEPAPRQSPSGEECNDTASINPPRPALVGRSEPEQGSSERVRLSGTYRSVPLTVVVDPTAWNDCPEMGGPGEVVWVLNRAIRAQRHGPTDRQAVPRRMIIAWIRGKERLPRGKHPTDFNGIAALSKAGWEFEATARLRGGKDRGGPGAADGPSDKSGSAAGNPILTSKELLELEAVVRDVTAGRLGENNAPLALAVREVLRLFKASDTAVITPAAPDAQV